MKIPLTVKMALRSCITSALALTLASCSAPEGDAMDAESRQIISARPLIDMAEDPWPTKPTEKLANQIVAALKVDSPDLARQIMSCAANDNPAAEQCDDGESIDDECLMHKGLWKGFLSPHLRTASTDLNGDGVADHLLRITGCGVPHPYTWDVYVVLSSPGKQHRLALETNVNRFDVMPVDKFGGKVIVEGISSYNDNGESARILVLKDLHYVEDSCFYRAQSEKVMRRTACNPVTNETPSHR
jgi:hypothetical protein